MKEMLLTQGKVALLDDEDFERLSKWKWFARSLKGRGWYAGRNIHRPGMSPRMVYLHREVLRAGPGEEVDHINGDGLDNRKANLRLCAHAENIRNKAKTEKAKTSRYKGVYFDRSRGRWAAQVMLDRRTVFAKRFDTELQAALAYNEAAVRFHGAFALLNTIETFDPAPGPAQEHRNAPPPEAPRP